MDDLVRNDQVTLRRFRPDDADAMVAACNDEMVQRYLPQLPRPYTHDDAMFWIHEGSAGAFAHGGAAYAIADPIDDHLLGAAGLSNSREGVADLGYWVAPPARGRGVATGAARLLAEHAFANGFARVSLRTEQENGYSQRVAIAAGFARESLMRAAGRNHDGSRHDLIVWVRLAGEPGGAVPRALPDLPGRDGARATGKLTDDVVTLRPLTAADAEETFLLRGLDDVVRTSVPPHAPDFDEVRQICERAESLWLAGTRADVTIRDTATGGYAGELMLFYNEPALQQALLGYSIAPAWRRRGYATRAVRLVSDWAFANTDIVRLYAGAAPENDASQGVLVAAGFAPEGVQRMRLPGLDGTRIDDMGFVLLSPKAVSSQHRQRP